MAVPSSGARASLGIQGLLAVQRFTHDLEGERRILCDLLGFDEVGRSGRELEAQRGERSVLFEAGDCRIQCTEPVTDTSRAARYLKRHPAGIGAITFSVSDALRAFGLLDARGGTPVDDLELRKHAGGELRSFSITTPIDDVHFQFVERRGDAPALPGFVMQRGSTRRNPHGIVGFDHITGNYPTLAPVSLWFEHVLGFEPYWNIEFHLGSGLRSTVLWDPASRIKFACNEPLRPNFCGSQIHSFCEQHGGAGIQHAALLVSDLLKAVGAMRKAGAGFIANGSGYYEGLRKRRDLAGLATSTDLLEELGVLADGAEDGSHLLQIFMLSMAGLGADRQKGPFFFELIQRNGHAGFGEGNFRALFEAIETVETTQGN